MTSLPKTDRVIVTISQSLVRSVTSHLHLSFTSVCNNPHIVHIKHSRMYINISLLFLETANSTVTFSLL